MSGANMPAKNTTGSKFSTGAGKRSQLPSNMAAEERGESLAERRRENQQAARQSSNRGKANLPTQNDHIPASHPKKVLGTTMHGKGNVPGYLQGK